MQLSGTNPGTHAVPGHRFPINILEKHPVDMLVIDRGHVHRPLPVEQEERWELAIKTATTKPKVVIESWANSAVAWENGPTNKGTRAR